MITSTPISTGDIDVPTRAFTATNTGLSSGTGQRTAITTIALCNVGTPDPSDETVETVSVNVYVLNSSLAATADQRSLIVSNLTIPAGETVFFNDERLILDSDDSIWVGATSGSTDIAGSFLASRLYVIETLGTTDWNSISNSTSRSWTTGSATVGGTFIATGVGTGDGTARRIMIVSTVSSLPV